MISQNFDEQGADRLICVSKATCQFFCFAKRNGVQLTRERSSEGHLILGLLGGPLVSLNEHGWLSGERTKRRQGGGWLLPLASCLLPLASYLSRLASRLLPLASCLSPLTSHHSNTTPKASVGSSASMSKVVWQSAGFATWVIRSSMGNLPAAIKRKTNSRSLRLFQG